jgi:hypothetical protein
MKLLFNLLEAAQIKESLGQRCAEQGLTEKPFPYRFSALSLWARASNFYQAIALGNELLDSLWGVQTTGRERRVEGHTATADGERSV